jgi:hypothetical protein
MHEGIQPGQPEAKAHNLTPEQVAEIAQAVVAAHANMPRTITVQRTPIEREYMAEKELFFGFEPPPPPPAPAPRKTAQRFVYTPIELKPQNQKPLIRHQPEPKKPPPPNEEGWSIYGYYIGYSYDGQ